MNETRKEQYIKIAINTNSNIEGLLSRTFREIKGIESKLNKDCCDWTVSEILDYYKFKAGRSLETLMVLNSQLGKYAQWCLDNNFINDSQNHYLEIDREILNDLCVNFSVLEKGIIDRDSLLEVLKGKTIKNYCEKFLVLALFEGVGGKSYADFRELRLKDFENDVLHVIGRDIKVSNELYDYAEKATNEYEYFPYGEGTARRNYNFEKSDDRIIKRRESISHNMSDATYRHWLFSVFEKIKNENNDSPVFTMAMLKESGRLEMIKNYMRKENLDPRQVLLNHKDEIFNQYGIIYAYSRYIDKWKDFLKL